MRSHVAVVVALLAGCLSTGPEQPCPRIDSERIEFARALNATRLAPAFEAAGYGWTDLGYRAHAITPPNGTNADARWLDPPYGDAPGSVLNVEEIEDGEGGEEDVRRVAIDLVRVVNATVAADERAIHRWTRLVSFCAGAPVP